MRKHDFRVVRRCGLHTTFFISSKPISSTNISARRRERRVVQLAAQEITCTVYLLLPNTYSVHGGVMKRRQINRYIRIYTCT